MQFMKATKQLNSNKKSQRCNEKTAATNGHQHHQPYLFLAEVLILCGCTGLTSMMNRISAQLANLTESILHAVRSD